jgi:hypothetical protein
MRGLSARQTVSGRGIAPHRDLARVRRAFGPLLLAVLLPLALTLVCLRSLARDGYLLQVDIVFGPRPGPLAGGLGAPVSLVEAAATDLLGGQFAGRLYAAGVLFLAGFAPMVLLRRAPWYARCVGGVLGILNPWVYDRMVEGQWSVVGGAAGLFLWVAAWEALQTRPGPRRAGVLALAGAGTAAFSPHMLGLLAVLAVGGAAWWRIWRDPDRLRWTVVSFGFLIVLLSYGVVSFFAGGQQRDYQTVRQFTRADFLFFRSTSSARYGLLANLAGLYGYWGERVGRFPLANQGAPWWPVTTALLVATTVAGAFLQRVRAWLLLCGLAGLALSASTAVAPVRDAVVWLAARVPLAGAYREPEKWSALWLVAVVTLTAAAVEHLAATPRRHGDRRAQLLAPALAYALIVAALVPAGLNEIRAIAPIVKPIRYPAYWYRTRDYLAHEVPPTAAVVVLPWHLYQPLDFTEGRLVANPARRFFPGRLVVPNNLEISGRETDVVSRYDRIGLVVARYGHGTCAVAREIRRLQVRWVLVLDAAEGPQATHALQRCGFKLVQGRPSRTAVLRSRFSGLGAFAAER